MKTLKYAAVVAGGVILSVWATLAQAVEIKPITSPGGINALLVEDYTVPLISVSYSFKGGSTQDLPGKEGTAKLLTNTLDEGAGEITSQDFQIRLQDNGMGYSFSAGYDSFSGGIKALRSDREDSFELLRLMLNEPRFDEAPVERMKASRLNSLRARQANQQYLTGKAVRETLFDGHPYGRPTDGTIETMGALNGDDLRDYMSRVFARDNLVVGIVGAISEEEAGAMLDKVFGALPAKAQLTEVPEINIETGTKKHIEFDTPQTNIRIALPGIKREDDAFFAGYLANYVLGGGSFNSRLYEEVREKRGLAYGVYSYLGTYDHAGIVGAGSATRADRAQQTVDIILAEIERMATEGPTAEELEKAKKYIRGSYAISNLDTSGKIASVLVAIQQANLGIDYIDRRAEYIDGVTLDDAKRIAAQLFGGDPTVITVGRSVE
ncbi:MAG: insulinase family protein [Rhizobiaceae bacterium]|nr:insulinase family protein [Rhizobiaceae bacterium]